MQIRYWQPNIMNNKEQITATDGKPTDIWKLANEIQADCHAAVESIRSHTKGCSYADAVNVWLFRKLAALEIRLRQMEAAIKMNEETNEQ